MSVFRGKTFRSGNSQAIRLPKSVAFPDDTEVTIVRLGDTISITPARPSMANLLAQLDALPKPPFIEVRDDEDIPERAGA